MNENETKKKRTKVCKRFYYKNISKLEHKALITPQKKGFKK